MAKGENIFRRRDGRWEARYIKGRELSGKIKYGYCYGKTYREAKEKAAKRKAALANGAPLPTARTQKPFSSYCLEWLHTKKCTVKESTYIKYSTAVNKHIIPKLGVCHPLGFTTELMDDFIKELQFEDELAPKTVHDILVVLHGILKFASSKFAGSFPAVEINYPKIGKKEMRVLSREEQARLVAYLHEDLDSCRFGILLALCTGIRIGELCALQWESISTNDKAIRIAKALQRLHDTSVSQGARTRIVIGPPKSDTSVRTIPMTEYATGLCRRMKPQSSAAYVLTGTEAFMEPRTLQYRLEKYTQACGLEGVHFHTLRHPYVKHTTKIFSLRLMDFQAQAYNSFERLPPPMPISISSIVCSGSFLFLEKSFPGTFTHASKFAAVFFIAWNNANRTRSGYDFLFTWKASLKNVIIFKAKPSIFIDLSSVFLRNIVFICPPALK